MDRVLVTGGTGFVGHWMQQTQPCNMNVMYCSRREYDLGFWQSTAWSYIVHLAPIDPLRILIHSRYMKARVLYASSGIVYHPENDTEYRQNKMRWERDCLSSGMDIVIARLFTFYGARLDDHKAMTQFEKAAHTHLPIHISGDGSAVRSYMHGSEMGLWLWTILLRGKCGEAYDVGSDEPITILELARKFTDNVVIKNNKPDAMPVYLPVNTNKTRELLDTETRKDLHRANGVL